MAVEDLGHARVPGFYAGLSSNSGLLKARSWPPPPPPTQLLAQGPCTEGTFTKVHHSVRGLRRHQEGLWQLGLDGKGKAAPRGLLRRGQRPTAPRQPRHWPQLPCSRSGGEAWEEPRRTQAPGPPSWPRSATLSLDQKQGPGKEPLSGQAWNAVLPSATPPTLRLPTSRYALRSHPSLPHLFLSTRVTRPLRERFPEVMLGPGGAEKQEEGMSLPSGGPPRRRWRSAWMPGCAVKSEAATEPSPSPPRERNTGKRIPSEACRREGLWAGLPAAADEEEAQSQCKGLGEGWGVQAAGSYAWGLAVAEQVVRGWVGGELGTRPGPSHH